MTEPPATPNHRLDLGSARWSACSWPWVTFVRDRTDVRLRGREALAERLDRPVLATIPPLPTRVREPGSPRWKCGRPSTLITLEQPDSPGAESYRTLRTRVARMAGQLDIKSLMVVSAAAGEAEHDRRQPGRRPGRDRQGRPLGLRRPAPAMGPPSSSR